MSLPTPSSSIQKLQMALQAKAKAEPSYRFYTLWDKIHRGDVLTQAYRRCRSNGGAAGADGMTFERIEEHGVEAWLENLQEELRLKRYQAQPLRRVWIPKSNGGQRPLGIPTIRDRVVQMAMVLVIGPIFETDLQPEQYGFRPRMDAKMAVRRAFFHVTQRGLIDVVDADLSDYFNTIPHGALMKCVSRRIADGQILSVIKQWLRAPVEERTDRGETIRSTDAADNNRGTPQGGVVSPLLANLYFRRFILAWEQFGIGKRLNARIVNYADDLVICCKPGNGEAAMAALRKIMTKLGLTVNEKKTRMAKLPGESFNFLGYTIGRFYGRNGRSYIGTCPSQKSITKLLERIHDETSPQWHASEPKSRVAVLNPVLRGWCNYFDQGPVVRIYRKIREYTERRLRRWLMRRSKRRGTGYKQYPDKFVYEELKLFKPLESREALLNAKA